MGKHKRKHARPHTTNVQYFVYFVSIINLPFKARGTLAKYAIIIIAICLVFHHKTSNQNRPYAVPYLHHDRNNRKLSMRELQWRALLDEKEAKKERKKRRQEFLDSVGKLGCEVKSFMNRLVPGVGFIRKKRGFLTPVKPPFPRKFKTVPQ